MNHSHQLSVVRGVDPETGLENFTIYFPPDDPPDVYFDTLVWISMSQRDVESLEADKRARGFRYRYSVTNYVELLSRLARGPAPGWPNPFQIVRAAFRRIQRLCDPEVLPSSEMEFLQTVGLSRYLHPDWIPDPQQTAIAVNLVATAGALGDITGSGIQTPESLRFPRWVVNPDHYLQLTLTDDASTTAIIESLNRYASGPLTGENVASLGPWFTKLADFFLLFRPSSGRTRLANLSRDEQDQFMSGFTYGVGRMFHAHTILIAKKTLNWGERIDPNDLYDALQLLLLRDGRIFVTNDKNFFRHTKDSFVQRVVPWDAFKKRPWEGEVSEDRQTCEGS